MAPGNSLPRLLATCFLYACLPRRCYSFLHAGAVGCCTTAPHLSRNQRLRLPPTRATEAAQGGGDSRTGVAQSDGDGVRRLEDLKVGDRLKGIVVSELEGTTGKKAWVRVSVARTAKGGRMRYVDGMIRLSKEKGLKPRKVAVDKPLTVFVSKVVPAEGRLEVSLRPPKARKPVVDTSHLRPITDLALGDELQGTVKTVTQFAAFVSCGVGRPTKRLRADGEPAVMEEVHGFLGNDDLPENAALSEQLVKTEDTNLIISEGDRLKVYVKGVLPSNGRYRLTLDPDVSPEKMKELKNAAVRQRGRFARRKEASDLAVGEEILGEIVKAAEFGFFMDVGAKSTGLVHISSISEKEDRYLGNLRDFARVGDKMYVEVKEVDEEGRLALSYVAREQDRPKPQNRRQRRSAERGEGTPGASSASESETGNDDDDDDDGGFLFDSSPAGGDGDGEEDEDGYKSSLDADFFDDM